MARLNSEYRAEWFDPRTGTFTKAGTGTVRSNQVGLIDVPDFPLDQDWGLRLILSDAPNGMSPR